MRFLRLVLLIWIAAVALIGCGSNNGDGSSGAGAVAAQTSQAPKEAPRSRQDEVPVRLRSAIATTLKVDESKVTPTASFAKDLGADDLGMVELVMAYEREFKIRIDDADADRFQRVEDVINYLQKRRVLR